MSQYKKQQFVLLHNFISVEQAQHLLRTTDNVPTQKWTDSDVFTAVSEHDEQDIVEGHPLFKFFMHRDVLIFALHLMQADKVTKFLCWTCIYEAGQYVSPHKDSSGDLQIIVCLQAPAQENGGQLCLTLSDGERGFFLNPGDAIIFNASTIQHYTTPLVASEQEVSPLRVVAVGRYYL